MARGAAEDHLAQAALGIGALDQKIGPPARGLGENALADAPPGRLDDGRLGANAVAGQVPRHLVTAWSRHRAALDGENKDLLGPVEEGHAEGQRPRRLARAVPRDHDFFAELLRRGGRGDQQRPPALEERGLEGAHRRARAAPDGPADDDQVEGAAAAPDRGLALRHLLVPARAWVGDGLDRLTPGHAVLAHEFVEGGADALGARLVLALEAFDETR